MMSVVLSACGGGGGGDGGGGGGPKAGAFTLTTTSASFSAKRLGPNPDAVFIQMHVTGSGVAAVGAAYRQGSTPATWLEVNITGTAPNFAISLRPNTTALPVGTVTTTVSVGTADVSGNVLEYKDVQVSYSLRDGVSIAQAPQAVRATLGHSTTQFTRTVNVATDGATWSASVDVPWITVPAGNHQGAGSVTLNIDTTSLTPGANTGTLTVVNVNDSQDRATIAVQANIDLPSFEVTMNSAAPFGGTTGLEMQQRMVHVALATGTNTHPMTASFVPASGGNWLAVNGVPSVVGEAAADFALMPAATAVPRGTYSGNVEVTATVNGTQISRVLPVTLNVDTQRIWASTNGVGLSSFPSRQTLTRTLRVFNSLDRNDVPLQASSDQPWLDVSVPDNRSIVLTVTPGALAASVLHTATVTISSTDPLVTNTEQVRVGFWRDTVDPQDVTVTTPLLFVTAHPVEPLVFTNFQDSTIQVFNVYTGALVRTLTNVGAGLGPMVFSSDGTVLYSSDHTTRELLAVDPNSGAILRRYQTSLSSFINNSLPALAYARPEGHPILISGASGEAFDAETGTKFAAPIAGAGQVVASKNGHSIYVQTAGLSPTPFSLTDVRYSTLNPAGLIALRSFEWSGHFDEIYSPSNGLNIAISEDDSHVWRANGAPYGFGVVDPVTLEATAFLPAAAYPSSVTCGWRGYCFGTAGPDYTTHRDLWIYDADLQPVGGIVMEAQNLLPWGLATSADDSRLLVGLTTQPNDTRRLKIYSTPQ